MKRFIVLFLAFLIASCASTDSAGKRVKPYYKTREGKAKTAYYNVLQFDAERNYKATKGGKIKKKKKQKPKS